jgi:hypothetical protein
MAADATCLVVGKRHAGKTTLMTDVMYYLKDRLDAVIGMNPTENSTDPVLGRFLPPCFVYDRYDEDKISHILEWQRRAVASDKNKAMRMGLILDDCMGETNKDGSKKKIMNSGTIGKIFKIGRHRKLFFWATLQYMRDAPPDARSNTDLLFLYNMASSVERQKCYKDFFGMLPTQKDFDAVLNACTRGYSCLVLDTRIAMRDPKNSLFFYTAKIRQEEFRVGRPQFWTLSNHFFVDRSDNELNVGKVLGIDMIDSDKKEKVGDGKCQILKLAP